MFDNESQNPKIMSVLADEWKKMGHRVIKFYPCYSRDRVRELNKLDDVFAFYFPKKTKYKEFLTQLGSCGKTFIKLFLCCICHPFSATEFVFRRIPCFSNLFDESILVRNKTKQAINMFKADVVVAGSNPFFFPHGLALSKGQFIKIWYQMDPHALNGMMSTKQKKREFYKEKLIYDRMDKILVQPNSYSSITSTFNNEIASKIFATKFPLVNPEIVVKPDISYFDNSTINCVYAGALMLPIRRPEYMLKIFSLFKNKSIHLYIWCGNLTKNMEDELKSLLPSNVSYLGSLPQSKMQAVLAGADILINLGNTISNQLPSKILDYISLRKPILNIYKVNDCPTIDILKDYPLSLSVSEDDDVEIVSEKIESFILENIGNTVSSELIKKAYQEYLPNSVAKYVLES